MRKIVTINKNAFGKCIILPEEGEVNVSPEGVVECKKDHVADMLVKNSPSWEYYEEPQVEEMPEPEPEPVKKGKKVVEAVPEPEEEEEVNDEERIQKIRDEFKSKLSLSEMKEIAGSFDEITNEDVEKYGKNKALMANFLIGKIGVDKIEEIIAG